MGNFLWLNWSGGGNLPPSLGIARVLTERGHSVTFAGRPEMVPRVVHAGFRAIEFKDSYAQVDRYPQGSFLTRAGCYLTSPAVAAEAAAIVAAEDPDVIVVDAMFPAALSEVPNFGRPAALALHTFIFRQLDMWRQMIARLDGMRQHAGFGALPPLDVLWQQMDRIVCTALGDFDATPVPGWEMLRHVGPVLENEKVAVPTALPWPDSDRTPLVLVSLSTAFEQRSVEKLQRSLDALGGLPVHVVATTGGVVKPDELTVPANAIVLNYAAHDPILQRAALAVSHGGHGTAMRSLRNGVPMVIMPGLAGDQPFVAAAIQEWGAGLALASDTGADAIRAAAHEVLTTPGYRLTAERLSQPLLQCDGASAAATELEALIAAPATAKISAKKPTGRIECLAQQVD
jgi:UDP:flavonoid glycosyltransferase YjiC (YdhE family)